MDFEIVLFEANFNDFILLFAKELPFLLLVFLMLRRLGKLVRADGGVQRVLTTPALLTGDRDL